MNGYEVRASIHQSTDGRNEQLAVVFGNNHTFIDILYGESYFVTVKATCPSQENFHLLPQTSHVQKVVRGSSADLVCS